MYNKELWKFSKTFPYLIVATVLGGLFLSCLMVLTSIRDVDFMFKSISIGIPVLFSSIVLLKIHKKEIHLGNVNVISSSVGHKLSKLFIIFSSVSIIFLITDSSRTLCYLFAIIIIYCIIFIQVLSNTSSTNILLLEIIVTMVNMIYGVTLKYPLYFGSTDILPHLILSEITYATGHIVPDYIISYSRFPLYHIFISESSYILGLDLKTSLFLVTAPIFSIVVLYIYLLFNKVANNKQIALLACLLYSCNANVLFYGTMVITRTMAFIAFFIMFYVLFQSQNKSMHINRYKILALILAVFVILVHQVSSALISFMWFIFLFCETFVGSKKLVSSQQKNVIQNRIRLFRIIQSLRIDATLVSNFYLLVDIIISNFYLLFNVMFINYWFSEAYSFTSYVIQDRIKKEYFHKILFTQTHSPHISLLSFIHENISLYIFLFFVFIGIGYILWKQEPQYITPYGIFSLIMLVFYVPNPLFLLSQTVYLLRLDRLELLLNPFMAFSMAVGLYVFFTFILQTNFKKIYCLTILLLFVLYSSNSVMYNDAADGSFFKKDIPRRYFTLQELNGFEYNLNKIPSESTVYSDYYANSYLNSKQKTNENLIISDPYQLSKIVGYVTIRSKELLDNGLLFKENDFGSETNVFIYGSTRENIEYLYKLTNKKNKIYSNSMVDTYF